MKFTVVFALEQKTGPEVNDGDGPSAGVDDDVFVLDVAVKKTTVKMKIFQGPNDL